MAGGFTKYNKLEVTDLGTEGTGDRIALFNSDGRLIGYVLKESLENFIPLSGTEVGKSITGDLEFEHGTKIFRGITDMEANVIDNFESTGIYGKRGDWEGFIGLTSEAGENPFFQIYNYNTVENTYYRLQNGRLTHKGNDFLSTLNQTENELSFSTTDINSKGFISTQFYNKLNDPNAFAQLGDLSIVDTTTIALSSSDLNTAYPDVTIGFRVICPNIILGALIYTKTSESGSSDVWVSTNATIVP